MEFLLQPNEFQCSVGLLFLVLNSVTLRGMCSLVKVQTVHLCCTPAQRCMLYQLLESRYCTLYVSYTIPIIYTCTYVNIMNCCVL